MYCKLVSWYTVESAYNEGIGGGGLEKNIVIYIYADIRYMREAVQSATRGLLLKIPYLL